MERRLLWIDVSEKMGECYEMEWGAWAEDGPQISTKFFHLNEGKYSNTGLLTNPDKGNKANEDKS